MATQSNRDKLTKMMAEVQADQSVATEELNSYFESPEAVNFLSKIEEIQNRTVPGGALDQVLTSSISVFRATKEMVGKIVETEANMKQMQTDSEKAHAEAANQKPGVPTE